MPECHPEYGEKAQVQLIAAGLEIKGAVDTQREGSDFTQQLQDDGRRVRPLQVLGIRPGGGSFGEVGRQGGKQERNR